MAPPIKGDDIVKRVSKPPDDDDEELQLPPIVEATIGFFERLGKSRVRFAFVQVRALHPCMFCGLATNWRLNAGTDRETLSHPICIDCREGVIAAPQT